VLTPNEVRSFHHVQIPAGQRAGNHHQGRHRVATSIAAAKQFTRLLTATYPRCLKIALLRNGGREERDAARIYASEARMSGSFAGPRPAPKAIGYIIGRSSVQSISTPMSIVPDALWSG